MHLDIGIDGGTWDAEPALDLETLVGRVVAMAAQAVPEGLPDGEAAVLFTDDAQMRAINKRFRDKDKATNVLAFPAPPAPAGVPQPLGDILLAHETVVEEAREQKKPLDHHVSHLVTHGLLHLLGYDHQTDEDAAVMEGLETRILAGLGIPDPYAPGGPARGGV